MTELCLHQLLMFGARNGCGARKAGLWGNTSVSWFIITIWDTLQPCMATILNIFILVLFQVREAELLLPALNKASRLDFPGETAPSFWLLGN